MDPPGPQYEGQKRKLISGAGVTPILEVEHPMDSIYTELST